MPTLLEKGTFSFHNTVEMTPELQKLLEETSIDILLNILRRKRVKNTARDKTYFLEGRCGSGKSTLMISSLYRTFTDSFGGQIVCSEPRIVLTESNAQQICDFNKDLIMSTNIGFQNGSKRAIPTAPGNIIFYTHRILANILLTSVLSVPKEKAIENLKQFKVIVIDEVHAYDDSLFQLLKYIKRVLNSFGDRHECPLFVFASATIDIDSLLRYYFPKTPIEELYADPEICGYVHGEANYPVSEIFLTQTHVNQYKTMSLAKALGVYFKQEWLTAIFNKYHRLQVGDETIFCRDVLVFIPTSRIILAVARELEHLFSKHSSAPVFSVVKGVRFENVQEWRNKNKHRERVLIICYGRDFSTAANTLLLNSLEQDQECRQNEIKIILSTPVIETGKTIDTLSLCIDVGLEQTTSSNPFIDHYLTPDDLVLTYVSKNQTTQRLGRVGRRTTGTFVHFYTKQDYETQFQEKEINTYINNANIRDEIVNDLSCYYPGEVVSVERINDFIEHVNPFIVKNSVGSLVNDGVINPFRQYIDAGNLVKITYPRELLFAEWLHTEKKFLLFDAIVYAVLNKYDIPSDMNFTNVNVDGLPWVYETIVVDIEDDERRSRGRSGDRRNNDRRRDNKNTPKSGTFIVKTSEDISFETFSEDIISEDTGENTSDVIIFDDIIQEDSYEIVSENINYSITGGDKNNSSSTSTSPFISIPAHKHINPLVSDAFIKSIETLNEILYGAYKFSINYDINRIW